MKLIACSVNSFKILMISLCFPKLLTCRISSCNLKIPTAISLLHLNKFGRKFNRNWENKSAQFLHYSIYSLSDPLSLSSGSAREGSLVSFRKLSLAFSRLAAISASLTMPSSRRVPSWKARLFLCVGETIGVSIDWSESQCNCVEFTRYKLSSRHCWAPHIW